METMKMKTALLVLIVIFGLIAFVRLNDPELNHADEFSDANLLIGGANFAKFGFIKTRFLPVHEPQIETPANAYTHYPPIADIMNGVLRIVFKTDSLYFFRVVSLFMSFGAVLLWFFAMAWFSGSIGFGLLAGIFYLLNPSFQYGADSLAICYSEFFMMLSVFGFLGWVRSDISQSRRRALYLGAWLGAFGMALTTFEYIIYLSMFFALFVLLNRRKSKGFRIAPVVFLWCAPVAAVALHFIQNTWYFGSVSAAVKDLCGSAVERIASSHDSPMALQFTAWVRHVLVRNISLTFLFDLFTLFLLLLLSVVLYHQLSRMIKARIRPVFRLFVILGACGLSWYVLFPAHSLAHAFVGYLPRHLCLPASLFFAICAYLFYAFVSEKTSRNVLWRLSWITMVLVVLLVGILNSQLPVTPERIALSRDFRFFKQCLTYLKSNSSYTDVIGVNYFRYPFIQYYTQRNTVTVFDTASLLTSDRLPDFFIFMPYQNDQSRDLYMQLNEKYDVFFKCSSAQYPAIVFKKKDQ